MKNLIYASIASLFLLSACLDDDDTKIIPREKGTFSVKIENIQMGKAYLNSGTTDGIGPGGSYSFSFNAGKGAKLSLATMLAQTNDLFYAFGDEGLSLYTAGGDAVVGDVSSALLLWDAGTEVNEYPGAGNNQAPRQAGANTGTAESKTVMVVDNEFVLPSVEQLVRVTISFN